ncbi:uncharacterized protein BT62DRAFT_1010311 [Guyanagaster necrorhizus]|uniref:Uncharacterized protein n=1 Tax=Guyanagaster necrorhizus TaxID=856835 RepID=A0A9P7VKH8_9AGAR|nr:uncharacterized protein BT62DRAFT_1010311 [Guyanagaster necrorhizus MCA 3950]KAG7442389.1 hypothetical protein BT62DRAFT_1010311 [Guyanagaster necrorhizus MCA 3950]
MSFCDSDEFSEILEYVTRKVFLIFALTFFHVPSPVIFSTLKKPQFRKQIPRRALEDRDNTSGYYRSGNARGLLGWPFNENVSYTVERCHDLAQQDRAAVQDRCRDTLVSMAGLSESIMVQSFRTTDARARSPARPHCAVMMLQYWCLLFTVLIYGRLATFTRWLCSGAFLRRRFEYTAKDPSLVYSNILQAFRAGATTKDNTISLAVADDDLTL